MKVTLQIRSFIAIFGIAPKIDCTRSKKYRSKLHISRSFIAIFEAKSPR